MGNPAHTQHKFGWGCLILQVHAPFPQWRVAETSGWLDEFVADAPDRPDAIGSAPQFLSQTDDGDIDRTVGDNINPVLAPRR